MSNKIHQYRFMCCDTFFPSDANADEKNQNIGNFMEKK